MKTELIIPTHDNDGTDNAAVIEQAIKAMCDHFGGVTAYDAKGYWTNSAGRLFVDNVTVLVSAATQEAEAKATLHELAREVLNATDQEAVFLSVGGQAEIIE